MSSADGTGPERADPRAVEAEGFVPGWRVPVVDADGLSDSDDELPGSEDMLYPFRMNDLEGSLGSIGLSHYVGPLKELGAKQPSDLLFVTAEELRVIGLTPVEQRRLEAALVDGFIDQDGGLGGSGRDTRGRRRALKSKPRGRSLQVVALLPPSAQDPNSPPSETAANGPLRVIDNSAVRAKQVAQLEQLRAERDSGKAEAALRALTAAAGSYEGNLLELSVAAAHARCTVGEISDALERQYGRYHLVHSVASGSYLNEYGPTAAEIEQTVAAAAAFEATHGRRPRILVAKMGQDGHDRGANVIASAFADLGFDVDVGPLFATPAEVARQAIDADVHVVGVSSQAAGHRTLLPALVDELRAAECEAMVVAGGVIPVQDYELLHDAGVAAVFGPGTRIPAAGLAILNDLSAQLNKASSEALKA